MKKYIVGLFIVFFIIALGAVFTPAWAYAGAGAGTSSPAGEETFPFPDSFSFEHIKEGFHLSYSSPGLYVAPLAAGATTELGGIVNEMLAYHSACRSLVGGGCRLADKAENKEEQLPGGPVKKKKLARALLFNGSVWLLDSVRYWSEYSAWIEDWQFELKWEDQKIRFTSFQANRFDSNPFVTNWTHGVSGSIYYTFARYHRLSVPECLLFELASSFWWEYVTEWREVISINDNFFSGVGGLPLGESFFRLSMLLRSKKGLVNQALGTLCNPVISICDLFGGKKWRTRFNDLEGAQPYFHLYCGGKDVTYRGEAPEPGNLFNIGMESKIFTIPGYGEPGQQKISRFMNDTLVSHLNLDLTLGTTGVEEFNLYTRAIIFGHFSQHLRETAGKRLQGYSLFWGAGSAFDLFKKKAVVYYDKGQYHYDFNSGEEAALPTRFTDKLAIINLVGPVLDLSLYSGRFNCHLEMGAYLDFALVNALALNKYSAVHDIYEPRKKTTLIYYGYYYAFGYTVSAGVDLSYGNFESGGKCKYQQYNSIDGRDRFQYSVVDDGNITDSRWLYKIYMGWRIPATALKIVLAYETIDRRGQLEEISHREKENRFYTQLRLSF